MARSVWKGPFVDVSLLRKVLRLRKSGKLHQMIKTRARNTFVIPEFMRMTFLVYNGKQFVPVTISTPTMIGHKLGEFAPTRTFRGHGGSDKR